VLKLSEQLSWGKLLLVFVIIAAAAIMGSSSLFAAVTITTDDMTLVEPSNVTFSTPTAPEIWIFPEQAITLEEPLDIDIQVTSTTPAISAGTGVKSYFIHLEKAILNCICPPSRRVA
tara:strand:- start:288 stop:638 length:351 start_codon:yes stop_codon:yes gene_type:complete